MSLPRMQVKEWMADEARALRASITADFEALQRQLLEARRELAEARAVLARFRALSATPAASWRVHLAGRIKFEARIRELVEGIPDLAVLIEPLLVVRRVLREQVGILHRRTRR